MVKMTIKALIQEKWISRDKEIVMMDAEFSRHKDSFNASKGEDAKNIFKAYSRTQIYTTKRNAVPLPMALLPVYVGVFVRHVST